MSARPPVSVIYPFYPHYRAPVMRALVRSEKYEFRFWGSMDGAGGIPSFQGDQNVHISSLSFRLGKRSLRITGYYKAVFDREAVACIIHGAPNWLDTWAMAILARLSGKAVLFWGHGWLRNDESLAKALIRATYFRLAHKVLVYGDRARVLAEQAGFPPGRVKPIYNSLDWDRATELYAEIDKLPADEVRESVTPWPNIPLLICTARLTKICRFDVLLHAMAALERAGFPVSLNLIGDGPERPSLEKLALELDLKVRFLGAIYDEATLARFLFAADLTVSPGKVGLTAMHSMSYGTPTITHGDLNAQMPEVEVVTPGLTGMFFTRDNAESLAGAMKEWLSMARHRDEVRVACRTAVEKKYTPTVQRNLIERALDDVLSVH